MVHVALTDTLVTSISQVTQLVSNWIPDATTNAERWEVDMLNNNGYHQYSPDGDYCEIYFSLSDTEDYPTYMPNYNDVLPQLYEQKDHEVKLSVGAT